MSKSAVKVCIYVEGGVVQDVYASEPDVQVEIFDVDDKDAEGMTPVQIEDEWDQLSNTYPYHVL